MKRSVIAIPEILGVFDVLHARARAYAREGMGFFALVEQGEGKTIEGWLIYGAALNEGRERFSSDEQFGQWVVNSGLSQVGTDEVKRDERSAAMWAAANPDEFETAKDAGNARTVRGIHAKWGEMNAENRSPDSP